MSTTKPVKRAATKALARRATSAKPVNAKAKAPAKPRPAARKAAVAKPPQPRKSAKALRPATPAKTPAAAAPAAAVKPPKNKLVRDSFTMPKLEYAVIESLKQRGAALAKPLKKSEVLRAGIKALAAMSDDQFTAAVAAVPAIKTGRPKTKKPGAAAGDKAADARSLD